VRIAVIGAGHLGRIHARLLNSLDDAELAGVVDPVAEVRERVADEFGTTAHEHHSEVASHIDAAVIAATTDQHYAVGRDLLSQGMHVLVEKPIAASVAEADELVALARANRCVLQVGHVERFNAAWSTVMPYLRRPRYLEAVRTSGYTFRSTDISVVLDLMIHDLDLVLSLVRSPVADVDAVGVTIFGPHEDMAHAHLRFDNGCVANLSASRTSFQPQRTIQVITDHTYVGVDFAASTAKLIRPGAELLRGNLNVHELSSQEKDRVRESLFSEILPLQEIPVEKCNAILEEQREFVDCIRRQRSPRVTGQQARDCLAVAHQILSSIAAKQHLRHPTSQPSEGVAASLRSPFWPPASQRRRAG
jgi:predicted dehydrogenase